MSDAKTHWHIIGAGAIGCLFADALARYGCEVTLILRPDSATGERTVIVENDATCSAHALNTVSPKKSGSIERLLVTTKAYDVQEAVASVAARVTQNGFVILLANGMGFAEQVKTAWPRLDLYCGITTEGAYRLGPQHIRHAGFGETRIGQSGMLSAPAWFTHFQHAVDNCSWDGALQTALWTKLAVNCIINPITALHGCRNGDLASNPRLATEVAMLSDEVARVCLAAGFSAVAAGLAKTLHEVIAATAKNRSSMLEDVLAGRPTEIGYINGYLLQVAHQHGIDTPHNRALLDKVLAGIA
ncbi:MAG: 2-dehydropantoate 2-reductase [Halioglobus sp.]|nr:2-dehydropantoate 2-reductase [Halioglobus sp.]